MEPEIRQAGYLFVTVHSVLCIYCAVTSALTFGLTGIIMLLFTQYCAFTAQDVRK